MQVLLGLSFAAFVGLVVLGMAARWWPERTAVRTVGPRSVAAALLALGVVGLVVPTTRLVWALATDDLTFAYVADHTRPGTSMALRLAGLWAGPEGSLLLFAAVTTAISGAGWARDGAGVERVAPIGVLGAGLAGALITVSWPFERLAAAPVRGIGVEPILEHPAMIIHPPLLYAGLAVSLAAFVSDRRPQRWAVAGAGIGIAALGIGAWWAYAEVGWGGWWAWDPVENTALIVWLMVVAGLHSPPLARWWYGAIWPAVAAGTALTRTSLRTSVHAFADASGLGWWLWPMTVVMVAVVGLELYRRRNEDMDHRWPKPELGHRGTLGWRHLVAVVLLIGVTLVVVLGTYRPFVGGEATAGWFFSRVLYLPTVVGLVAMSVLPNRDNRTALSVRVVFGVLLGAMIGWWLSATSMLDVFQWVLAGACGIALAVTLTDRRWRNLTAVPQLMAHLGVILIALGVLGSTANHAEIVALEAQEEQLVSGHVVRVVDIGATGRTGTAGEVPRVRVDTTVDGTGVQTSFDVYPERGINLIEVGTRSRVLTDVQVVFLSVDTAAEPRAVLRIDVRPLNQLVWWGSAAVALAMVVAIVRRNRPMD